MGVQRRRGGPVAAVLLLAVALSAFALGARPGASEPATPTLSISVFGDSVLLGARDQLLTQFAGQPISVDAAEDRSLLGAVSLFQAAGPTLGNVVVTDFGYNDGDDPTEFRRRIDAAMATLAGVQQVIWLNQREWQPGRAGMNAELAAAATRYPNLEVVDWNAQVAAHPDYVYGDGIHLTPAGQAAMATLVRQTFDRYVASLQPTTTTAAPTTVAPPATAAPATGSAAPTGTHDDAGLDGTAVALLVAGGVLLVLLVGGALVARQRRRRRRRRRAQRREVTTSSS